MSTVANGDWDNGASDAGIVTGEHTAAATTAADVSTTATTATEDEVLDVDNARWYAPPALCGENCALEGEDGVASNGGNIPCANNVGRTDHDS